MTSAVRIAKAEDAVDGVSLPQFEVIGRPAAVPPAPASLRYGAEFGDPTT